MLQSSGQTLQSAATGALKLRDPNGQRATLFIASSAPILIKFGSQPGNAADGSWVGGNSQPILMTYDNWGEVIQQSVWVWATAAGQTFGVLEAFHA